MPLAAILPAVIFLGIDGPVGYGPYQEAAWTWWG
jgi:hypothetical protein